jgi:mRNA interferase MazF
MTFKKYDIVLVSFPFTDLRSLKKRPALIISPDYYNSGQDIIVSFITSKLDVKEKPGDFKIKNWKESNLPKPSMIRMKFATISKSIVDKKIGKLGRNDINDFRKILISFLSD